MIFSEVTIVPTVMGSDEISISLMLLCEALVIQPGSDRCVHEARQGRHRYHRRQHTQRGEELQGRAIPAQHGIISHEPKHGSTHAVVDSGKYGCQQERKASGQKLPPDFEVKVCLDPQLEGKIAEVQHQVGAHAEEQDEHVKRSRHGR